MRFAEQSGQFRVKQVFPRIEPLGRQKVAPRREKAKKFHESGWAFQCTSTRIPNRTINHVLFDAYNPAE